VRCGWTLTVEPLAFWIRIDLAVFAGFVINDLITLFTFVDYCVAATAKKTAAFFAHESAFQSYFNSLTKHLNDPLCLIFFWKTRAGIK
jgi:hypothetical protein